MLVWDFFKGLSDKKFFRILLDYLKRIWNTIKEFVINVVRITKSYFQEFINEFKNKRIAVLMGKTLKETIENAQEVSMEDFFKDEDIIAVGVDEHNNIDIDSLKIIKAENGTDAEIMSKLDEKRPIIITK